MKWTTQIARIYGIPIRVHWSIALIFVWLLLICVSSGLSASQSLFALGMILAVFLIIVLHELGHALMAAHFDVPTRDIILSPVGGLARFEKIPENPVQEISIFLAGPGVNLLLAILFVIGFMLFTPGYQFSVHPRFWRLEGAPHFWRYLFQINLVLLCINLLPIFPLDGGRVFRSLLAMRLPRPKATFLATRFGLFLSCLIVVWGVVVGDYILAVIGFFVCVSVFHQKTVKPT
jgi:Zn-dependent protease